MRPSCLLPTLERDGRTGVAYLDYDKKHLIAGQIFDPASGQTVRPGAAPVPMKRLAPASLPTQHSIIMGNPKGTRKLFVFSVPKCPFCAKLHMELKPLAVMEPDLAIYVKMYPLKMHPHAYDKARVFWVPVRLPC